MYEALGDESTMVRRRLCENKIDERGVRWVPLFLGSVLHCCISRGAGVGFYDDISALYYMEDGISSLWFIYWGGGEVSDIRCCLDVVSLIRDVCQIITHGAGKMLGRLLNRHITKVPMTDSDIRAVVA